MSEEIFDVVDADDAVIGQASREEVHRRGLRHRAVHVLVFNGQGQVLLQRRSLSKDCSPGLWDSSAAGHVEAGEDYDQCAVREVAEELALSLLQPPRRLFKIAACAETSWEFVWVYRVKAEGPFTFDPEEIIEIEWFSPHAVSRWIEERPAELSGALRILWPRLPEGRSDPD